MILNIITSDTKLIKKIKIINNYIKIKLYNVKKTNKLYGGGGNIILNTRNINDIINKFKIESNINNKKIIYFTPQGKRITQNDIKKLSMIDEILIICGKYKGLDKRLICEITEEWSIGDYIIKDGEYAIIIIINAIIRLLMNSLKKNVIHNDSFNYNIFDYPNYAKPFLVNKIDVPKILITGNHKNIRNWRVRKSFKNTWIKRPDLINKLKKIV